MTNLGTLGGTSSVAAYINEAGQITGASIDTDGHDRGFLWQNGTLGDLGTLGGLESNAGGINNSGAVAGWALTEEVTETLEPTQMHAFLWQGGVMQDLKTFGGPDDWPHIVSYAADVNDAGQVVGSSYRPAAGGQHAFLWQGGVMQDLGTLWETHPSAQSDGLGLNELGQVVGYSWVAPSGLHAFLWLPGPAYGLPAGINDLGFLGGNVSAAQDINDHGQVVGYSTTATPGLPHAFLWHDGAMLDLNDRVLNGAGWTLVRATAINNAGQIVGHAIHNDELRAFLLTPAERPWTLMFYLDGDNDLSSTYGPIINRLEAAAGNPAVKLVALLDQRDDGDSAYFEIQHDTDLSALAHYQPDENYWAQGEVDMGAPQTLSDFITWAMTHYPAEHYALILTDHGGGIGGMLQDDRSGSYMTLDDLQQALAATPALAADPLDVLYFDMCLMAMVEVAYEVRDYADFVVASEHLQWAESSVYTQYVAGFDLTTIPAQGAAHFVDTYAQAVAQFDLAYTLSAQDVSQLDPLVAAVDLLATALLAEMPGAAGPLSSVADAVQRYDVDSSGVIDDQDAFADLRHLAALIETELAAYPDVVSAAQAVQAAVGSLVIAEQHASTLSTVVDHSRGVSIFFPKQSTSYYNGHNNDFAAGTQWGGVTPLAAGPVASGNSWGPMLVAFIQHAYPGSPDVATAPDPVARLLPAYPLYLPLALR